MTPVHAQSTTLADLTVADEQQFLDQSLDELFDIGGMELVLDLYASFDELSKTFAAEGLVAVANQAWSQAAFGAHALRSAAGTLGLRRLSLTLEQIEMSVQQNNFPLTGQTMADVPLLRDKSMAMLKAKMASLTQG